MEDFGGTLVYLIIGYICGVFFAPEAVSANLLHTDWYNIWTYAWLFGWPFLLLWHFLAPFVLAAPATTTATTAL